MKIEWNIEEKDITNVINFMKLHENAFVQRRISKNVNKKNIIIDQDSMLKSMIMCLLTSQQRSGPNSSVNIFLCQKPFPLTIENIKANNNPENFVKQVLKQNGLNRYINKIAFSFGINFKHLESTDWKILTKIKAYNNGKESKVVERELANEIQKAFFGFGPKQSRNILQDLGVSKYEIPIDSRTTNWLNKFGFPLSLSSNSLQDKEYYHFVSDGFQVLCEKAKVYPCVLDAAIFSSFDNGEWTEEVLDKLASN